MTGAATSREPQPWLWPLDHPPPLGQKLFLLTTDGVAVVGTWSWAGGFLAWAPMMKVPQGIKRHIGRPLDWNALRDVARSQDRA